MIKAIITDWHGVVDVKTFEKFVSLLAKETKQELNACKEKIKKLAISWTTGEIEPEVFWKELKLLFNLSETQAETLKRYILTIEFNKDVVSFFENNKNKYKIYLLSDCPKDKAQVIKEHAVARLFLKMSFSCDKQLSKENPRFFLDFLDELKLPANQCLYVDDNKKHISIASSLGFKTCLFEKAEDLISKLPNTLT